MEQSEQPQMRMEQSEQPQMPTNSTNSYSLQKPATRTKDTRACHIRTATKCNAFQENSYKCMPQELQLSMPPIKQVL